MFFRNFYSSKKNLTYQIEGTYENSYSLSIVNKAIAKALELHTKSAVRIDATKWHREYMQTIEDLDLEIKALSHIKLRDIDVSIRNIYPPYTKDIEGKIKIIGPYGWEESKFPKQYVLNFNRDLNMVFTMSSYVRNLLKENGVTIPIVTTGIIVEDILHIDSKPFLFNLPYGFRLLHISSLFPRKGADILLKAFDVFDENLEITLIIKGFPNPHNNIIAQLDELGFLVETTYEKDVFLYKKKRKKILLINKSIPESQIKYLYEQSNILVAPSFGEGFGLPMAEAMLLELPVLTTGYGGQSDFCTTQTSWLIDFTFQKAKTHINLENSLWAVPKLSSLIEEILTIYSLPKDAIVNKTKYAKQYILENYSSKRVVKNIETAINNISL